jgi:hypothetical protein
LAKRLRSASQFMSQFNADSDNEDRFVHDSLLSNVDPNALCVARTTNLGHGGSFLACRPIWAKTNTVPTLTSKAVSLALGPVGSVEGPRVTDIQYA